MRIALIDVTFAREVPKLRRVRFWMSITFSRDLTITVCRNVSHANSIENRACKSAR